MIKHCCTMSPSRHESHWLSFDANILWRGLACRPMLLKNFLFIRFVNNFTSPVTIFEIATSAKRPIFDRICHVKMKIKTDILLLMLRTILVQTMSTLLISFLFFGIYFACENWGIGNVAQKYHETSSSTQI